jgi:hypothetical protein
LAHTGRGFISRSFALDRFRWASIAAKAERKRTGFAAGSFPDQFAQEETLQATWQLSEEFARPHIQERSDFDITFESKAD